MRSSTILISVVLLLGNYQNVRSLSAGPPAASCVDMTPQHGVEPQTGTAVNTISLPSEETTYEPNKTITIEITGQKFKGIMLQARLAHGSSTTPVGTFSSVPTHTKTMRCSADDDTFVHSDATEKISLSVTWNPPAETVGEIQFRATVVSAREEFWVGITSGKLAPVSWNTSSVISTTEARGAVNASICYPLFLFILAIAIIARYP